MPSLEIIAACEDEDAATMSAPPSQSAPSQSALVSTKKKKEKKKDEKARKHSTSAMDPSIKRSRQLTLGESFFGAAATTFQVSQETALASPRRKQLRDIVMGVFKSSSVENGPKEGDDVNATMPLSPPDVSLRKERHGGAQSSFKKKKKKTSSAPPRISLSPLPTASSDSKEVVNPAAAAALTDRPPPKKKKRSSISPTEPPRQKRIRWCDDLPADRVEPRVVDVASVTSSSSSQVPDATMETQDSTQDSTPLATPAIVGTRPIEHPMDTELARIRAWRTTYRQRVQELVEACHQGLPEEQLPLALEPLPPAAAGNFPDSAILSLATIVEGQSLPLEELAAKATRILNQARAAQEAPEPNDGGIMTTIFEEPLVRAKIQSLATRQHFIPRAAPDQLWDDDTAGRKENARMYRWEVVVPSAEAYAAFFPNVSNRTLVKQARGARKKISAHLNALLKALTVLQEAEQILSLSHENDASEMMKKKKKKKKQQPSMEKVLARVHTEVDKLVQFEREQEAHRLAQVARGEKLAADRRQKEQQKQAAAAARQKEKELQQRQLAESKEAAQKAKEAAQKAKEAARSVEPKEKAKPATGINRKQKQCMMSFLAQAVSSSTITSNNEPPSTPPPARRSDAMDLETGPVLPHHAAVPRAWDVAVFRSAISGPTIPPLSSGAPGWWLSYPDPRRRRRTPRVTVPVFVTIYPEGYQQDNPFAAQPYAEQVRVSVPNKYKFLSFYEDVRPPYYGTWSKTSRYISGRQPFRTDPEQLEYDVDSEGEWEEGDDEVGEELGDDGMDEEEKELEDEDDDDEEDGWLAADDEVDDEENDEPDAGIRKLRKKKVGTSSKRDALSVCIVAPCLGQPLSRTGLENGDTHCRFEGLNANEALDFLECFRTVCLDNAPLHIQAFPPALVEELDPSCEAPVEKLQIMTQESMKIFASFVHNCSLGSKDKLIDEFLAAHANVSSSRALTLRTLDSIAEKKKHPCNGTFFWEVKTSVLESLGLAKLAESAAMEVAGAKQEAMKTIVRFVHNNRTASKEKIVDDLRASHESVTASRAEALRILQSIAVKAKHPDGGWSWIVKDEVRSELGLRLEGS
jgi:Chromatin assembly factor 1 subunit A